MNVFEVSQRGLDDEASLTEKEWPIFVVAYFESVADMQGWDHFYVYHMEWYPSLVNFIKGVGDRASLDVLKNYENHFKVLDVDFDSNEIDRFLSSPPSHYLDNCPDWRDKFDAISEQRWNLIQSYYINNGIELELEGWL